MSDGYLDIHVGEMRSNVEHTVVMTAEGTSLEAEDTEGGSGARRPEPEYA